MTDTIEADEGERPKRRRQRLSRYETRERMLDTAASGLAANGLTAGLNHLSFEEIVKVSGVSRAAAYRCWPHKNEFLADLVVELSHRAIPVEATRNEHAATFLGRLVRQAPEQMADPDGRARLLDRVVRATAADDFDLDKGEIVRWRTYLALVMSAHQMRGSELGHRVAEAIETADEQLTARLAMNYRRILEFFGFRPRIDYATLAAIGLALMRGLVLGELVRPNPATSDLVHSTPAIAFAGLVVAHTEVDDTADWDDARIEAKLRGLEVADYFG